MNKAAGYFGKKGLILMLIAGLLLGSGVSYAFLPRQTEEVVAYTPLIDGAPSYLFVQQASSGSLIRDSGASTFTLTLYDVASQVQYFSDRPQRIAGQCSMESFVTGWDNQGFGEDPPNAALVLLDAENNEDTLIVELTNPSYNTQTNALQYTVAVLEDCQSESLVYHASRADSSLPEQFGRVNLFIDDAASSDNEVTVGYQGITSSDCKIVGVGPMEIISGARVGVGDEARKYLQHANFYELEKAVISSNYKMDGAPAGVKTIYPVGTTSIGSNITEFDIYFGLSLTDRTWELESLWLVIGFTVKIQENITAVVKSPHDGVVLGSGNWGAVNGTTVSQGEALFDLYTGARPVCVQVMDIIDGTLPYGVSAQQIFFCHGDYYGGSPAN